MRLNHIINYQFVTLFCSLIDIPITLNNFYSELSYVNDFYKDNKDLISNRK